MKLNSGYHMPLLGLGTSQDMGLDATKATAQALLLGYRHFDTAMLYGERELFMTHVCLVTACVPRQRNFCTVHISVMQATKPRLGQL